MAIVVTGTRDSQDAKAIETKGPPDYRGRNKYQYHGEVYLRYLMLKLYEE